MRRVLPPEQLPDLVGQLDDIAEDQCAGDELLLLFCTHVWPTRTAQDS